MRELNDIKEENFIKLPFTEDVIKVGSKVINIRSDKGIIWVVKQIYPENMVKIKSLDGTKNMCFDVKMITKWWAVLE